MLFTYLWPFVCWGVLLCQSIETTKIQIIDERRNWWEAQRRCKVKGTKLYTPGTDDIPAELWKSLQPKTYYWGTTCFCLEEGYETTKSTVPEKTCPGNVDEKCGNIKGVSVYKLDSIVFSQEEDTYCAYVEDNKLSIYTSTYDDCRHFKDCYVCSGARIHINCEPLKSWYEASEACDLVKLNGSVLNDLLDSMRPNSTVWIGLYKYIHRRWINGRRALRYDGYGRASPSDTWCLSVYKQWNGRKRLYWRPCSENRNFICEDVNIPTSSTTMASTSSPQSSSSATTSTTVTLKSSPQSSASATKSLSSGSVATTDNINSTHAQTPTAGRKDARKPSINPVSKGGFIGLGVGCLLLVLTVLVVIYLVRRQKKLCFEKRDGNQPIHFTSAAGNIPYGLAGSEADTVVTPPDTSTVPTAIVRPSVHSDNVYINNAQINEENEYNVLSKFDSPKVPVPQGNPYNHLPGPDGGDRYKGDYDTANWVPQGEDPTTGMKNTVTHPDVSNSQVFEEEPYNVLGQHNSPRTVDAVAGVYDHVAVDEGEYATAHSGRNVSEVDDTYSHIPSITKPCEDYTYEVAGERQSGRFAGDTYNHDVKVDGGRGDTTDYYNTRSVLRDNGNLEGHVEGDDESVRRDQENVYSLATDISDV